MGLRRHFSCLCRPTVQLPLVVAVLCGCCLCYAFYAGFYTISVVEGDKRFFHKHVLLGVEQFKKNNNGGDTEDEIERILQEKKEELPPPPIAEEGRVEVNLDKIDMKTLRENELTYVRWGGWVAPSKENPGRAVALIIPFRKREGHLPILLRHLFPLFKKNNMLVRVFVIEQVDKELFNRGKLLNVGFREALKYLPFNCFVFHDVDLIPENENIPYNCQLSPAHLSVAIDKFEYRLLYEEIFGGIEMFTRTDFENVNGFPNNFWGWGGEDDNLYHRLVFKDMILQRPDPGIARYKMIVHDSAAVEVNDTASQKRVEDSLNNIEVDGLNSLKYRVRRKSNHPLYTLIQVDLNYPKIKDKERYYEKMSWW